RTEPTIAATTDAMTTARRKLRCAGLRAEATGPVTRCMIHRGARGVHRTRVIPGETPSRHGRGYASMRGVPKRVLIVDDHQPFRAVARELLESAGYVVSGEAADA